MSSSTTVVTPQTPPSIAASRLAEEDMFQRMEMIQNAVNPYLEEMGIPSDPPNVLDPALAQGALDTLNEVRAEYGEQPITNASMTRRLLALLNRVATVVEKHLLGERDIAFNEEGKVRDETLPELQSWTRWQGGAHMMAGFGAPALMIASMLLPTQAGDALKQIATSMAKPAADSANSFIESWKMPGEHGRQLYFTTRGERDQAIQIYQQLPEKVQQLLSKLIDQMMAMYRATGQRG
ncbi:MAG: hypothetical protein P0S96_04485 [Simkaniaceae bacterium]|nr:hypothetical protein [Candidatus Sacchlamyda saccharinae]